MCTILFFSHSIHRIFGCYFFSGLKFCFTIFFSFFLNSSLLWSVISFSAVFSVHAVLSPALSLVHSLAHLFGPPKLTTAYKLSLGVWTCVCVYLCEHRKIVENLCVCMCVCVCIWLPIFFSLLSFRSFMLLSLSLLVRWSWSQVVIGQKPKYRLSWSYVLVGFSCWISKRKHHPIVYPKREKSFFSSLPSIFKRRNVSGKYLWISPLQAIFRVENSNGKLFRFALIVYFHLIVINFSRKKNRNQFDCAAVYETEKKNPLTIFRWQSYLVIAI